MTIKGILLAGVALCSISLSPAFAKSAPSIHVLALHQGGAAVKSVMVHNKLAKLTSTFGIYSYISTSDYKVKTPLVYTYYTFNNSGSPCNVKDKIKLSTKKTAYAKLSTATETVPGSFYSCSSPVTFYGDVYDLTAKKVKSGTEDSFVSTLTSKILYGGTKYDATLNLDLTVIIE